MSLRLSLIVGIFVLVVALADMAQGQRISIGPGGISAGVSRYGVGVGVGVNRGGRYSYGYGPGYYYDRPSNYWYSDDNWVRRGYNDEYDQSRRRGDETPQQPAAEELTYMNWKHLRRVLRFGAERLEDDLDSLRSGGRWKQHLQVAAIQVAVADDRNAPPDAATTKLLGEALTQYDATAAKPEFASIARLWGFRTVQLTLREITKPAWERQRHQLADASRELDEQLSSLRTGKGWKKHLALPAEIFSTDASNRQGEPEVSDAEAEQLQEVLTRFDKVSSNSQYSQIAQLPAFRATHEILAVYMSHFIAPPAAPGAPE